MSTETETDSRPARLDPLDRALWQEAKIRATLITERALQTQRDAAVATHRWQEIERDLVARYQLAAGDSVDDATGEIRRAPAAAPA